MTIAQTVRTLSRFAKQGDLHNRRRSFENLDKAAKLEAIRLIRYGIEPKTAIRKAKQEAK